MPLICEGQILWSQECFQLIAKRQDLDKDTWTRELIISEQPSLGLQSGSETKGSSRQTWKEEFNSF